MQLTGVASQGKGGGRGRGSSVGCTQGMTHAPNLLIYLINLAMEVLGKMSGLTCSQQKRRRRRRRRRRRKSSEWRSDLKGGGMVCVSVGGGGGDTLGD